ncbi:MAG: hypothetical protein RLZZ461_1086 [Planctomycetota bacterium]|jgi:hypothetical protein
MRIELVFPGFPLVPGAFPETMAASSFVTQDPVREKRDMAPRFPGAGSFEPTRVAAGAITIAILAGAVDADIIRVDDDDPAADFATIQEAVDAAVDGDRIEVWPGYYSGSKTLDPVVRIDGKSITIVAIDLDPAVTVIAGQGVRRCVEWTDSPGVCKLIGFTLDGGSTTGSGGGMLIDGAAVEIEECVLQNCFAGNDGGAIHSRSETVFPPVVRDSRFEGNQAALDGGAIAAIGGFDCLGCRFADGVASFNGGAIVFFGNPAGVANYSLVEDCDVVGCEATIGGGIYALDATLIVTSTRFDDCVAGDSIAKTGWGGGIAMAFGELWMTGGRFAGCEGGESSGGLDLEQSAGDCTGVSFTGNTGWGFGGAIYGFGSSASIDLVDCDFSANLAAFGGGGAIACQSLVTSLSLERCTFDDNLAFGPGYCIDAPNIVTAVDCDFNAQAFGDAPTSHLALSGIGNGSRFESCRFIDARSVGQASSVRATAIGGLEFIRCVFENNETIGIDPLDDEGAIYINAAIDNDDPIRFHDCQFRGNGACCFAGGFYTGRGGAIRVDGRTAEVSFCVFGSNTAFDGGSLHGTFQVSNSILNGGASLGYGGAANLGSGSTLVDCRISGSADCNYPWFSGGSITVDGCTLTGGVPEGFKCAPDPAELAGCRMSAGSTVSNSRFCNYEPAAIYGTWTDLGGNSFNPTACNLADINGDGVVNGADLAQILALWGTPCLGCAVDINEDGQVDGADLALVLAGWG